MFLAKNRFSDYVEKFLEGGCDDFSFIINLDESAILEMQRMAWNVKKFVAAKFQKETSASLPTRLGVSFIFILRFFGLFVWSAFLN